MRVAKAVYLEYKGWFWVVPAGNKSFYYGPYRDADTAAQLGPVEHRKQEG